jgi:hypothetical protein
MKFAAPMTIFRSMAWITRARRISIFLPVLVFALGARYPRHIALRTTSGDATETCDEIPTCNEACEETR